MITTRILCVLGALALITSGEAFAAGPATYQVTGPVLEVNDNFVAVQKGKDRWEIARNASTNVNGDLKVGDKVTITYTMTATKVEAKSTGKADKTKATPSATPKS
jgi:hypothetical protein